MESDGEDEESKEERDDVAESKDEEDHPAGHTLNSSSDEEEEEEEPCVICQEKFDDTSREGLRRIIWRCQHAFHASCTAGIMEGRPPHEEECPCPLCRMGTERVELMQKIGDEELQLLLRERTRERIQQQLRERQRAPRNQDGNPCVRCWQADPEMMIPGNRLHATTHRYHGQCLLQLLEEQVDVEAPAASRYMGGTFICNPNLPEDEARCHHRNPA
jgi:hypothetical protein